MCMGVLSVKTLARDVIHTKLIYTYALKGR